MSPREASCRENTTSDRCPWTYKVLINGGRKIAFFDDLSPFGSCIPPKTQLCYMLSAERKAARNPIREDVLQMTFHCLIVGSRGYTDYASFKAKCDALLAEKTDIEIVSGGASGTDAMEERYAHEHGYSLQVFPADWSRYGNRAGYVRNREMHSYISAHADRGVIAFWDGMGRGTAQSFALSKEFDNPIRVVRVGSDRDLPIP